jgi:hypothetical protein
MNKTTEAIEKSTKVLIPGLCYILNLASESYERYWGTSANTDIASLADADPVTVSSKLKKSEFVSGIALAEAIVKFFGNQDVSNATYITTARTLTLGDSAREAVLTNEVESIGDVLYSLGSNLLEVRKQAKEMLAMYVATELSAALAGMSDKTIMFGASMTKAQIVAGMNALEQLVKLLEGNSPAKGDYMSVLASLKVLTF